MLGRGRAIHITVGRSRLEAIALLIESESKL